MNRHKRYPPEVRERAVRLVLEHQENYHSQWAALTSIVVCWRPSATCHRLSMKRCTMMGLTGHAKRHDSMYGLLLFLNSS